MNKKIIFFSLVIVSLITIISAADLQLSPLDKIKDDSYFLSEDIQINNFWINKYYNYDYETIVSRISLNLNNLNNYLDSKKVSITIAYPKGSNFLSLNITPINPSGDFSISKGEKIIKNKSKLSITPKIEAYSAITNKINLLSVPSTDKSKLEIENLEGYELKSFEVTFIDDEEYLIQGYISSEYGLNEKLYIYVLGSFAGGSGTAGDPYQIETWAQLNETRDFLTSSFILNNDLNSSTTGYDNYASTSADGGAGWLHIGNGTTPFTGTFNGNGNSISDIYVYRTAIDRPGLFGTIGSGGVVSNVTLGNVSIYGADGAGGLAGATLSGSSVYRVSSSGIVKAEYASAGLVGYLGGALSNSYSTANVWAGTGYHAGLVGPWSATATTLNCYSNGSVTGGGTSTGGLIAYNQAGGGSDTGSFWDTETSGKATSVGGTGKTTLQMKDIATYNAASWDIVNQSVYVDEIWFINNGSDYPKLGWEFIVTADTTKPNVIIKYPLNITYTTNISALNFTATDETALDRCWYSTNGGVTNSSTNDCTTNFTSVTSVEGSNTWKVYTNDTSGNENSSSITFYKDTVNPSLTITYPSNDSIHYFPGWINLTLTVDATDTNGISSMWYTVDNGVSNTTFTNTTGIHFEQENSVTKQYTIYVYTNDTNNLLNSSSTTVTIVQTTPVGQGSAGSTTSHPTKNSTYEIICPYVYDFIIKHYSWGEVNYTLEEFFELIRTIQYDTNDYSFTSEVITDHLINYDSRCKGYKELPFIINSQEVVKVSLFEKYKGKLALAGLVILIIVVSYYSRKKRWI